MTSTHYLRLDPVAYRAVAVGQQHAICLQESEGVVVGDHLVLREYRTGESGGRNAYTGAWLMRRVSGRLAGDGIAPTHAVYSFADRSESESGTVSMRRQIAVAEQQGVPVERFFRVMERKERARREVLRRSLAVVARVRSTAEGSPT